MTSPNFLLVTTSYDTNKVNTRPDITSTMTSLISTMTSLNLYYDVTDLYYAVTNPNH